MLARATRAQIYGEKPRVQWSYYTYFENLPTTGMEVYIRPYRGWGAAPTNDGLTMVVVGWPIAEAESYKADPEGDLLNTFELVPEFAERVRSAIRVERLVGASLPGYLREPYGPGWVLAGDAAYNKDPITAQGILDAFRDGDSIAAALDSVWQGETTFDTAMVEHQRQRDEHVLPMYEFTSELATMRPPPRQMLQLLAQIQGNQAAMDAFVSINAATVSPADFFNPAYLGQLLAA